MPHSTRSSTISTPCSASHPGIGVRRPVASTTSRRAVTSPSSTPTPRARGPVAVGSTSRPAARRPPSIRISGRRSTARRSTDSNVVRRAATATRSSSPGCPTPAGTVDGTRGRQRQLGAPGLSQVVEHVGGFGGEDGPAPGEERVRVAGLRGGAPGGAARRFAQRVGRDRCRAPGPDGPVGLEHEDVDSPACERQGGHEPGHAAAHDHHVRLGAGVAARPSVDEVAGHAGSHTPRR